MCSLSAETLSRQTVQPSSAVDVSPKEYTRGLSPVSFKASTKVARDGNSHNPATANDRPASAGGGRLSAASVRVHAIPSTGPHSSRYCSHDACWKCFLPGGRLVDLQGGTKNHTLRSRGGHKDYSEGFRARCAQVNLRRK